MAVIKNKKTGMWEVRTYYKDWTGERKQKTKRGFAKKSEAVEWERNFKLKDEQSISMSFKSFVDIYLTDLEPRIKRNTFLTKKHIIETKILPYFGKRKLDEIRTSDDVKLNDKKTLRAGGVTQECTQLKVTLDMDTLSEMVEEIFEALAEDEDIEKMIIDVCQALDDMDGYDFDVDADDVYDEFVDACEDMVKSAKYIDGDEEVVMLVYVDNTGNVVGREIEVEDDVTITLFAPEDGKKAGYKVSVEAYGTTYFSLEGSGTKSGNSLDATFALELEKNELLEITTRKLDLDSLKAGLINGTVEVRLASGVSKLLDLYFENQYSWYEWWYGEAYDYKNDSGYKMATKVLSFIEDMVLSMDASMSKDKRTTTISLAEESGKKTEQLVSLKVAAETGSGKKVSVPSSKNVYDATDIDDLEDWWDELDWKNFLKKLDKTSLPSDWIDIIDDISDEDLDDIFW